MTPERFDPTELIARFSEEEHLQKLFNIVRIGQTCGASLTPENFKSQSLERTAGLGVISQLSRVAKWLRPTFQTKFSDINWNGLVRMKRLTTPTYYRVRRFWTLNTLQVFLPQTEAQLVRALATGPSNAVFANG
jgi:uncharacterized protein with HEPN domain